MLVEPNAQKKFIEAYLKGSLNVDHHWLKDCDHCPIGNFHGIVQDSEHHLWIQNSRIEGEPDKNSYLLKLNREGKLLKIYNLKDYAVPHGLELIYHRTYGETLLHTDSKNGLMLTDLNGQKIWHCPKPDFYTLRQGGSSLT